ncbi:hypothetical protein HRR83_005646 [Exophiala dermatitidis]|uniref:Uncharacterized protein n=1 Tax=Exophiala dermatitidis TaxID=5970 RepID=A0AAN6EKV4_EXODE|nr:hypothetical protein HRR73_007521 [Exophiala dermatitidis]KAJ4513202.1 hypothetical protein HRR74_006014 [Exophiala dermatitidis]KAJ4531982.1 hypothetical protein HRR77_008946 [Exophiala dermatitidis]KAJ4539990.1 hypothetical protein HRR76_003412 [Exophiala dermatitidis]KAJ4554935.1 hypothetical protein HRR79_009215 [Exophiala dermatitidis]
MQEDYESRRLAHSLQKLQHARIGGSHLLTSENVLHVDPGNALELWSSHYGAITTLGLTTQGADPLEHVFVPPADTIDPIHIATTAVANQHTAIDKVCKRGANAPWYTTHDADLSTPSLPKTYAGSRVNLAHAGPLVQPRNLH